MSKISGQFLISGQFQDSCEISGQLGALHLDIDVIYTPLESTFNGLQ